MAIQVEYKYIDGAHFFLGVDELSEGLCVAHADLKIAFDAVAPELQFLVQNNYQQSKNLYPETPFEEFQAWVETVYGTAINGIKPIPSGQLQWATQPIS